MCRLNVHDEIVKIRAVCFAFASIATIARFCGGVIDLMGAAISTVVLQGLCVCLTPDGCFLYHLMHGL